MELEKTNYTLTFVASGFINGLGFLMFVLAGLSLYQSFAHNNIPDTPGVLLALLTAGFVLVGISGLIDATVETARNTRILAKNILDNNPK